MPEKGRKMTADKYGKYIVPAPIMQSVMFPQIKAPQINIGGPQLNGIALTMNWSYLTEPFTMVDHAHAHDDFDQVIIFLGGDPTNIREFGGEIWFYFGEEQEKHVITSSTYICVPRGVIHCPLIVKKINKPVVYMDLPLTADYLKKKAPDKK